MGETKISGVGTKVCHPQDVDTHSDGGSSPVDMKNASSVAVDDLSSSSSESPAPSSSQQSGSQKTYNCTQCDKKFTKPSKLKNHTRLHSGERPFACKHTGCDKAYTNSSHLLRHTKSHQGKVAPLQICVECKAMFRSSGGLRKHMKTIHMSESEFPYSCNECGRAFRKKKLLSYHMHEHGGDPAFKCEHCNVQFTHKYLFNRHMRGHRTHPCRWSGCPEVLANWSLFRKHMALHNREDCTIEILSPTKRGNEKTGVETTQVKQEDSSPDVKPSVRVPGKKCPVCNEVFSSRSRYYTHIEQHKDIWKCPHPACERVYTYKRNLDTHIRLHHTTEARFVCEICDRNLASKQKLEMHKISIHVNNGHPHIRRFKSAPRPRKDKGMAKRALAAKLAGIEIPYEEEKRLLRRDEEFHKGDPLSTANTVSSPESGFFSVPGVLRTNLNWSSDHGMSSEEGYRTGEVTDASDLQGPSETQRRNEDHQDTSSDEEFMYSGGDSSDEESGSGHCEDDDDEDADGDGDDDHDDDDQGGDDDDDDFNEDEDGEDEDEEAEENNGHEEGGEDNNLAQEDNNGKRPGSESPTHHEIQDGGGDFGVDRDSTVPSEESLEDDESPEEFITGDLEVTAENQRSLKRRGEDLDEAASKKHRSLYETPEDTTEGASVDRDSVADKKQLNRNVDPNAIEVKIAREKACKRLPEDVWVSTFQTSIDHCLPESIVKKEPDS